MVNLPLAGVRHSGRREIRVGWSMDRVERCDAVTASRKVAGQTMQSGPGEGRGEEARGADGLGDSNESWRAPGRL